MANDLNKNEMPLIKLRRINPNGKTLLKLNPFDDAQFGLSEEDEHLSGREFAKLQLKISSAQEGASSNLIEWEITQAFLILPDIERLDEQPSTSAAAAAAAASASASSTSSVPTQTGAGKGKIKIENNKRLKNAPPSYNECVALDSSTSSKKAAEKLSLASQITKILCDVPKPNCYRDRKYEVLREKLQNPVNLANPDVIELPKVHNEHPVFALSEILEYADYDPTEAVPQHQIPIKQIISVQQLAQQHEHFDIDVEMDKFDLQNYPSYMEGGKITLGSGPFKATFVKHSPDEFVTVCQCINCLDYRKIIIKYVVLQMTETRMLHLFLKVFTNYYGSMLKSPAAYNTFQSIVNQNKDVYWLTCGVLFNADTNQMFQYDHRNMSNNVVMVLISTILMVANPCMFLQVLALRVESIVRAYAAGYKLSLQEPANMNREEAEVMLDYIINGYEDLLRVCEQLGNMFFAFEKNLLHKLKLPWEVLCKRIYQHYVFLHFEDGLLSCLLTLTEKPITDERAELIKKFIIFDEEMKSIEKHWPFVWMEINKFIICAPEYERRSNMSDVYRIFKSLANDALNIPEVENIIYPQDDDNENILKNIHNLKDHNMQWFYTLNFLAKKWNIHCYKPPNTTICDDKCVNCNELLWFHIEICNCIACSFAGSPIPPKNYEKRLCEACSITTRTTTKDGTDLYDSKLLRMCISDDQPMLLTSKSIANRRQLLLKSLENISSSDSAAGDNNVYHIAWAVFKHLPERKPFKFKTVERKYFCNHCENTACIVARKLLLNTLDPSVTILLMSYYHPLEVTAAELCIIAPNLRLYNKNLVGLNLETSHKKTVLKIFWIFIISLFAEHFMELKDEDVDINPSLKFLELMKGDIKVAYRNLNGNKADNRFFDFLQFLNSHPCGEYIDIDNGFGEQIEIMDCPQDRDNSTALLKSSDAKMITTSSANANPILLQHISAEQKKLQEQFFDKQNQIQSKSSSGVESFQPTAPEQQQVQQTIIKVEHQHPILHVPGQRAPLPPATIPFMTLTPNNVGQGIQTVRRKQRIMEHIKLQQEQHFQQELQYLHHQQIKQHEMMRKQRLQQAHQLMQEKQQILQKQQLKKQQQQLNKSQTPFTLDNAGTGLLQRPFALDPRPASELQQPKPLTTLTAQTLLQSSVAKPDASKNAETQSDSNVPIIQTQPSLTSTLAKTQNQQVSPISPKTCPHKTPINATVLSGCNTASSSTTTTLTSKMASPSAATVTSSPVVPTPSPIVSPPSTNQSTTAVINPATLAEAQSKRNAKSKKCKSCFEHPELAEHCLNGHCSKKRIKKDCSHARVNEARDRLRKKLNRLTSARKNENQKDENGEVPADNSICSNENPGTSKDTDKDIKCTSDSPASPAKTSESPSTSKSPTKSKSPSKQNKQSNPSQNEDCGDNKELQDKSLKSSSETLNAERSDDEEDIKESKEEDENSVQKDNNKAKTTKHKRQQESVSPSTASEKSSIEDIDEVPFFSSLVQNLMYLDRKRREEESNQESSSPCGPSTSKKAVKRAKQKERKEEEKRVTELCALRTQYQVIYFKEFINKLNLKNQKLNKKKDKKKISHLEASIKNLQRSKCKVEKSILELIATIKQANRDFKFSYLPTKEQQKEKLEELELKYLSNGSKSLDKHDIDKLARSLLKLDLQQSDESQSRDSAQTPVEKQSEEINESKHTHKSQSSTNAQINLNAQTIEINNIEYDHRQGAEYPYPLHIQPKTVPLGFLGKPIFQPMCYTGQPTHQMHQQIVTEMPNENSADPSKRIVTIRRVNMPNASEPQVTVTAKGASPDKDKLLYTFVNGQMVPTTSAAAAENMKNGVQYYEFPQIATMTTMPPQMTPMPMHVPVPPGGLMPMPIPIQMRYPAPHILPGHPILLPPPHQQQVPVSMYQTYEAIPVQHHQQTNHEQSQKQTQKQSQKQGQKQNQKQGQKQNQKQGQKQNQKQGQKQSQKQIQSKQQTQNNKKKGKKGKKKSKQNHQTVEIPEEPEVSSEAEEENIDDPLDTEENEDEVPVSNRSARNLEELIAEAAAAAAAAQEKLRQEQEKQLLLEQEKEKQEEMLKLQQEQQKQKQNQKKSGGQQQNKKKQPQQKAKQESHLQQNPPGSPMHNKQSKKNQKTGQKSDERKASISEESISSEQQTVKKSSDLKSTKTNAITSNNSTPSPLLSAPIASTAVEKPSESGEKAKRPKVVDKGQFDNNPYKALHIGQSDTEWDSSRPTSPETEPEVEPEKLSPKKVEASKKTKQLNPQHQNQSKQSQNVSSKKVSEVASDSSNKVSSNQNVQKVSGTNAKAKDTKTSDTKPKTADQATNTINTVNTVSNKARQQKQAKQTNYYDSSNQSNQQQKNNSNNRQTSSRPNHNCFKHFQQQQSQTLSRQRSSRSQVNYGYDNNHTVQIKNKKQQNIYYSNNITAQTHQSRSTYNSTYFKNNEYYENDFHGRRGQKPTKRNNKQFYGNNEYEENMTGTSAMFYKGKDSNYPNKQYYDNDNLSYDMQKMHISNPNNTSNSQSYGNSYQQDSQGNKQSTSPSGYSIMDQLKCGVQVENLALPPGITLTKVDPVKSEQLRQKSESIKKLSQPLQTQQTHQLEPGATIIAPSLGNFFSNAAPYSAVASANTPNILNMDQTNGVIMVEANPPPKIRSASNDSAATTSSGKSSKNKKKKNKKNNAEENTSENANAPKMITLRNPMFHGPDAARIFQQNQIQAQRTLSATTVSSATPPVEQQAAIIKNENGIYTIRNPALHQAVTNGLVASGFANLTNVSYYTPQEAAAEAARANAAKNKDLKDSPPKVTESFSYFSSPISPKLISTNTDNSISSNNLNNISISCTSISSDSQNFNSNGTDLGTDIVNPVKKPLSAIGSEIKNAQRQKPLVTKEPSWSGFGLDLTDTCVYRSGNVTATPVDPKKDFQNISSLQEQYRKSSYYNGFDGYASSVNAAASVGCRSGGGSSIFDTDCQMPHSCGDDSPPPVVTGYNSYLEGIPNTGVIRYDDASFLKTLIPGQRLNNEVSIHNVNDSNFNRNATSPLSHQVEISPIYPIANPAESLSQTASNYRENDLFSEKTSTNHNCLTPDFDFDAAKDVALTLENLPKAITLNEISEMLLNKEVSPFLDDTNKNHLTNNNSNHLSLAPSSNVSMSLNNSGQSSSQGLSIGARPIIGNNNRRGNTNTGFNDSARLPIGPGPNVSITSISNNNSSGMCKALNTNGSNIPQTNKSITDFGPGVECLETFIKKMNSLNISTATVDDLKGNANNNLGACNMPGGDDINVKNVTINNKPSTFNTGGDASNVLRTFNVPATRKTPNDWWQI